MSHATIALVLAALAVEVPEFYLTTGHDSIVATKTSDVGSYDWAIRWAPEGTEDWTQTGYSGDDTKTATGLTEGVYEVQGRNRLAGVYSLWGPSQLAEVGGSGGSTGGTPGLPPPGEGLGPVWTETDIAEGVYDGITVGPDHLYLRPIEDVVPDSVWVEIPYAGSAYVVVRDESGFGPFSRWYPVAPERVLVPYDAERWLDVSGFTTGDLFKWARLFPPRGW